MVFRVLFSSVFCFSWFLDENCGTCRIPNKSTSVGKVSLYHLLECRYKDLSVNSSDQTTNKGNFTLHFSKGPITFNTLPWNHFMWPTCQLQANLVTCFTRYIRWRRPLWRRYYVCGQLFSSHFRALTINIYNLTFQVRQIFILLWFALETSFFFSFRAFFCHGSWQSL